MTLAPEQDAVTVAPIELPQAVRNRGAAILYEGPYAQEGDYAQSVNLFEQVAWRFDKDPSFDFDYGLALTRIGGTDNVNKGITLIKRGIKLQESQKKPASEWMHLGLAEAYGRAGKYDESRKEYKKAHTTSPGNPQLAFLHGDGTPKERALKLNYEAHDAFAAGRPLQALLRFERAIALVGEEELPWLVHDRAKVLLASGHLPEAVLEFEKSVDLLPSSSQAHFSLAEAYEQTGTHAGRVRAAHEYQLAYNTDWNNKEALRRAELLRHVDSSQTLTHDMRTVLRRETAATHTFDLDPQIIAEFLSRTTEGAHAQGKYDQMLGGGIFFKDGSPQMKVNGDKLIVSGYYNYLTSDKHHTFFDNAHLGRAVFEVGPDGKLVPVGRTFLISNYGIPYSTKLAGSYRSFLRNHLHGREPDVDTFDTLGFGDNLADFFNQRLDPSWQVEGFAIRDGKLGIKTARNHEIPADVQLYEHDEAVPVRETEYDKPGVRPPEIPMEQFVDHGHRPLEDRLSKPILRGEYTDRDGTVYVLKRIKKTRVNPTISRKRRIVVPTEVILRRKDGQDKWKPKLKVDYNAFVRETSSPFGEFRYMPDRAHSYTGSIRADELLPGIEPNVRRQDKIIAAIIRQDPRLILQDTVLLSDAERANFRLRCTYDGSDKISDRDYRAALLTTPTSIKEPKDEQNLRNIWKNFTGDEADKRRMRRIVAFVTKGSIGEQAAVQPDDLYTFVRHKCPDAVAFERIIPRLLAVVENAEVYKSLLHEVGLSLYGSQWVYLQQGRLAERQTRESLPRAT